MKGNTEFFVSSAQETMEVMRRGAMNRAVSHTRTFAKAEAGVFSRDPKADFLVFTPCLQE